MVQGLWLLSIFSFLFDEFSSRWLISPFTTKTTYSILYKTKLLWIVTPPLMDNPYTSIHLICIICSATHSTKSRSKIPHLVLINHKSGLSKKSEQLSFWSQTGLVYQSFFGGQCLSYWVSCRSFVDLGLLRCCYFDCWFFVHHLTWCHPIAVDSGLIVMKAVYLPHSILLRQNNESTLHQNLKTLNLSNKLFLMILIASSESLTDSTKNLEERD